MLIASGCWVYVAGCWLRNWLSEAKKRQDNQSILYHWEAPCGSLLAPFSGRMSEGSEPEKGW